MTAAQIQLIHTPITTAQISPRTYVAHCSLRNVRPVKLRTTAVLPGDRWSRHSFCRCSGPGYSARRLPRPIAW
jgi:hypothetical protein